jgi:DNA polymerase-3 subunit epsilon
MRQIFLDTETTGLNAASGDRIIEIGCVEMINRQLTGCNKHFYINPQRPCHEEAIRIHGLTNEFLADKPLFAAISEELLAYLSDAEIIIHNAAFDVGFLNAEFARLRAGLTVDGLVASVTDSLLMAREMFPGKANSLDALCKRLEVDNSGRAFHGALLDAELLAEVFIRMTRGQHDLIQEETPEKNEKHVHEKAIWGDVDFSKLTLLVQAADSQESLLHESTLDEIDKASKGQTVWRKKSASPV